MIQPVRLFVVVRSAAGNRLQRKAIRESWMAGLPEGMTAGFLVSGEPDSSEDDTLAGPPSPDTFEWLFLCDDETYLVPSRLETLACSGGLHVGPGDGGGLLVSGVLWKQLVGDNLWPHELSEERIVEAAALRGIKAEPCNRLGGAGPCFPLPDNDTISFRPCDPIRLGNLHSLFAAPFEEVFVFHPHWKDHLLLSSSGFFTRRSALSCGMWRRNEDGAILLAWEDAPAEVLNIDAATLEEPLPSKTIAVFLAPSQLGLPHIDAFLRHNPGVQVHVITLPEVTGAELEAAWRGGDARIMEWWEQQGRHLDFDHVAFLEWDVLFAQALDEVFPHGADFYCKDVIPAGKSWYWFRETGLLPQELQSHAMGVAPFGVIRLSRGCLSAIYDHPSRKEAYAGDIFCELRIATLAAACGYMPQECPGTLSNVSWQPVKPGSGKGVWHPVKTRHP